MSKELGTVTEITRIKRFQSENPVIVVKCSVIKEEYVELTLYNSIKVGDTISLDDSDIITRDCDMYGEE